ncbi:MAG: alpha-ketoglutarate-dependent dioxygenase AlkB [Bacteroidia bacterium]|nr:alpha-ketoglutarate-dependent dioxygenase AlkB [Bacteroidia bacterium]
MKKVKDGEYLYIPNYFSENECVYIFTTLLEEIRWKQEPIQLFGKKVLTPRLTAWYGEKSYAYSGRIFHPQAWTNTLIEIKKRIEKTIPINFNSVLLNRYRNGNDSVAWHADNEKELGINPVIASVSFGATRNFKLRHLQTKETIELLLSNGSLLIMQGALQHHWQHQIPKTKKIVGERINLTFRVIQ